MILLPFISSSMAPDLVLYSKTKRQMKKILMALIIAGSILGCKKAPKKPVANQQDSTRTEQNVSRENQPEMNREEAITRLNNEILQILKNKQYDKLSAYIHPEKGMTFSMYAFVSPKEDKHFTRAEFEKYLPSKTLFTWGSMDGSGDLYKASLRDYLSKWVYSKDFTTGKLTFNEFSGAGNSLNNLREVYKEADFTENYIKSPDADHEMDWKTLRMVFEPYQGTYYLTAIINDQWTI